MQQERGGGRELMWLRHIGLLNAVLDDQCQSVFTLCFLVPHILVDVESTSVRVESTYVA